MWFYRCQLHKALDITLYNEYKIHLVRGIEPRFNNAVMPNNALAASAFNMYSVGVFTVIGVPALGLQVLWDKGTRVYIYLESSRWEHKVEGLCGNFNGNSDKSDEFNGMTAIDFGNSFKDGTDCVDTVPLPFSETEPCGGVSISGRNGQKIPVKSLQTVRYSKTVETKWEAQELLISTANVLKIPATLFGQECARLGAPTKWRSQNLCPMMCDYGMQYSPCAYACPQTCKNIGDEPDDLCSSLPCVEGCVCPPGQLEKVIRVCQQMTVHAITWAFHSQLALLCRITAKTVHVPKAYLTVWVNRATWFAKMTNSNAKKANVRPR
ncbi:hypothetical protein ScPMuIL_015998 [Solemya velum]